MHIEGTLHHIVDIITEISVIASLLHTFLPPWDFLNDFPQAQKVYKAFIYVIGYVAISGRSSVYRTISIKNAEGVNNYVAVKETQQEEFVKKEVKKELDKQ